MFWRPSRTTSSVSRSATPLRWPKSFDDAKVSAEIEVYKGANHGWMPPDSQNHDEAAAERGWAPTLELFKKALA